jgi:hypothetical protein
MEQIEEAGKDVFDESEIAEVFGEKLGPRALDALLAIIEPTSRRHQDSFSTPHDNCNPWVTSA